MNKRPKSREETPKEGSDNAKALPHRNNMRPRCTKCKGLLMISGVQSFAPEGRPTAFGRPILFCFFK
jgi:hypothetical protein